jgi:hypothetical protein
MKLYYIELKTGYNDNGPAWITSVKRSKSGQTIYWNGKSLRRYRGVSGNYADVDTGDEYWISGVKKDGTDRHWAGSGKIKVDTNILEQYLQFTGQSSLKPGKYEIADLT